MSSFECSIIVIRMIIILNPSIHRFTHPPATKNDFIHSKIPSASVRVPIPSREEEANEKSRKRATSKDAFRRMPIACCYLLWRQGDVREGFRLTTYIDSRLTGRQLRMDAEEHSNRDVFVWSRYEGRTDEESMYIVHVLNLYLLQRLLSSPCPFSKLVLAASDVAK